MTDVQIQSVDGGEFSAYMAKPEVPNGACIVVLQEIFGVNGNIRGIVDDFAAAGYLAIAPDLFWRQAPGLQLDPASDLDRERAMTIMKDFDQSAAVEDAWAALQHAASLAGAGAGGRVAAVGYCLGGKLAYLMAARCSLAAAVSYYGTGIQAALSESPNISGAILLHIAGDDHLCPPEAQAQTLAGMQVLGDLAEVVVYPGVGHAFARRGGAGYDHASAQAADAATLKFLAKAMSVR